VGFGKPLTDEEFVVVAPHDGRGVSTGPSWPPIRHARCTGDPSRTDGMLQITAVRNRLLKK
jgi:hypothetical protein